MKRMLELVGAGVVGFALLAAVVGSCLARDPPPPERPLVVQAPGPTVTELPLPKKRGVVPAQFQELAREAFGAEGVAEDDLLRITSRRCRKKPTEELARDGRALLIEGGFTRLVCMRRPGDIDFVGLLSYRGLKRAGAIKTLEAGLKDRGVEEVGLAGSDGQILNISSRKCDRWFLRDLFVGDGRKILRDEGGFEGIRCEKQSGEAVFVSFSGDD